MQESHYLSYIQTPYQHISFNDPISNKLVEGYLATKYEEEGFFGREVSPKVLDPYRNWRDDESIFNREPNFPGFQGHKFLQCDDGFISEHYDNDDYFYGHNHKVIYFDELKSRNNNLQQGEFNNQDQDHDTDINSNELVLSSKFSQSPDALSLSNESNHNAIHEASISEDHEEVELTFKYKVTKPAKISKRSKKIGKSKSKGKSKGKKNKRVSERLKNIVKNYGKNCAAFAISDIGLPFLTQFLKEDEIECFKAFIKSKIPSITNIANFRDMILVSEKDTQELINYKKAFQSISEIFIRDYSTNWIFHSPRINDVKGHIFARSKMLRRVRDPAHFTYIH